ncbi:NAD(+) synthase [Desulfosporosinus nitroreducens]|uniref:NH(3)-dependent NAD(+) synthetase n=1 Tax=Desulfosporosinus nitroreducens TaxID=2018668 RepID=A0ABT8QQG4_9FIRM|nr:NAD(+) synthase [Desulfosporosinus nitroreducens]MCO1602706.1 NAD(+) synthase [Desulfosporosinus nitroreducens]MDO0823587.1 NAD(+) synthase [Desulfosporosinus nitroreducens]
MWTDNELSARIDQTVEWLQKKVTEANAKGVVVGISGGVDSAVVAGLCSRAFPENCIGVVMPSHSNPDDTEDALWIAEGFEIRTIEVNLSGAHTQVMGQVKKGLESISCNLVAEKMSQGNLKARLRMSTLYAVANAMNYMVVGTDNAPESYTGYFTKYGDGGVDLLPISSLTKTEVRAWARMLGLPMRIATRVPTAGLWPGQTDESELGITYDQIDRYLLGEEVSPEVQERIESLHRQSEHKRNMPPSLELPKLERLD